MKNLADILRNAPEDTMLYSPVTGPVRFKKVYIDNTIEVHSELDNSIYIFEEYGRWLAGKGECVLWPSSFERTWDDWQSELLVDGDYVYDTESEETFIFVDNDEDCALIDCFGAKHFIDDSSYLRFASPEEIEVFKTKRDESEVEFKKDDYIVDLIEERIYKILKVKGSIYTILDITDHDNQVNLDAKEIDKHFRLWNTRKDAKTGQILRECGEPIALMAFRSLESDPDYFDSYGDVWPDAFNLGGPTFWTSDCCVPATCEEQEYFYKKMREAGYYWNAAKGEFVKQSSKCDNCLGKNNAAICADLTCQDYETVTPSTFKDYDFTPFEKVLVRDDFDRPWQIELYSNYDKKEQLYNCLCSSWNYCIPYNERTKHLLRTTSNQIRKA